MNTNRIVLIVLAIAVVLVAGYILASDQPVVRAQGVSSVDVTPDEVYVYLVIESKNATQTGSQSMNNLISDRVVAELTLAGVKDEEIKFINFYSSEYYDWKTQRNDGYVTSRTLAVKLDDFSRVSKIVDAGIKGGAYVSSINLALSQELQNQYKVRALEEATKDARDKAEAQARGLDRSLGSLKSVESQDFGYYPVPYYTKSSEGFAASDADEARSAAGSIAPNEIEVSASVSVSYTLSRF